MTFRRYVWNAAEGRARAPVRLLAGFVLIALFAVVGTVVADLAMTVLWPASSFAYYLVGTTLGLGVGAIVGVVVVTDTIVAGPEGFLLAMAASLALFAVVGLSEELVVRGFVLKNAVEGLAGYGATVAVAVAVAVSSLLFGHPVSGLEVPARVLVVDVTGPTTWTGGAFGPEAGLLGVFAALAGLVGIVVYARTVEGRIGIHADLLTPTLRGDEDAIGITDDTIGSEGSTGGHQDVGHDTGVDSSE